MLVMLVKKFKEEGRNFKKIINLRLRVYGANRYTIEKARELKAKGMDTIVCISVDNVSIKAWKDLNIGDEMLLSDGNGDFTKAVSRELDLSDKPIGLGVRSRRYAMHVKNGVSKILNWETIMLHNTS
ncbi:peroxiredoxin-2E-2, chloroplastic-like [Olea europaea subsp. europaea]|uniref:glutaredoxin-dependent peroxiredoxin n=1 Tax=Olea europaea subsp. europaea TaxID=158383 RepID=A0A8S0QVT5_OLEEU|nr:peroxiredoxin-2E-2, chloroplastic-like [Olea europaea subsp. europaea]